MSQPYIGEIRMFAGNFAPNGWQFCNGQLLSIAENDTLFNLIGTTYGGDGQETFALPNLQSRLPVHQGALTGGNTYQIGEMAGVEEVTLTQAQIPAHNHVVLATSDLANSPNPEKSFLAAAPTGSKIYSTAIPSIPLHNATITTAGGDQPHSNLQPYLCVNFIISLFGIYPSQT